ncbi:hypothetical protein M9H77_13847 [Catharanthus roseus]|uniref:Uncharacterized protein n=1 Tax=Catharanthus roseus TaxID=4058 RepID=A0ACC0BLL3_CATRO|nr:hypothetical protein M9H77_13847 [Catharanthus roseus]
MQTLKQREKGKRVSYGVRATDGFIYVNEAANFEEWTRNIRKIAPGYRVHLSDMQSIKTITNLFNMIGWVPLLTVNELFYLEMIYEFYANFHKGRIERVKNIPHQWVLSRFGGRDIAFDDRRAQDDSDEDDDNDDKNEEQEGMNVDEEESDTEQEEETHRKELRRKKRQERTEGRFIFRRSIFGVLRLHYIEAKDLGNQGIMKKKRSSH